MSSVIWCGPVVPMQVPGATIPGASVYSFPCVGRPPPPGMACRALTSALFDGQRFLPLMLAKFHADPAAPVYFGAHSAGGIVVRMVCSSPGDRRQIRAVMLSDAMFGELEGFVSYAAEAAAAGDRMFVATVSNHSDGGPTGTARLKELKTLVEGRLGTSFEELPPSAWHGIVPTLPVQLWRLGSVWLANYDNLIGHGHTVLQAGLWKNLLQPWDATAPPLGSGTTPLPEPDPAHPSLPPGEPAVSSSRVWLWRVVAVVGGVLTGYGLSRLWS